MQFVDFGSLIPIVAILSSLGFASRRMEREAGVTADEKRALEQRLAVLERIVTDRGLQTAEEIDALRDRQPERLG